MSDWWVVGGRWATKNLNYFFMIFPYEERMGHWQAMGRQSAGSGWAVGLNYLFFALSWSVSNACTESDLQ